MTDHQIATLAEIVESAQRQLGFRDHVPAGAQEPTARLQKIAGTNGQLQLRELLPPIPDEPGVEIAVTTRDAGQKLTIFDAARLGSRVLSAGARLVTLPPPRLVQTGSAPALVEVPAGARLIGAAPFAHVADDADVTPANLETFIAEAKVDRASMQQSAVRVPVSRPKMNELGEEKILAEVLHAIALGLGRAVDVALLRALAETNAGPFGVGSAAAKGLRWDELRAIIGTAGAGATIDAGRLYAGGVAAEITDSVPDTIVAAFARCAVFVTPEIEVLAERIDARGGVTLTCWFGAAAVVPDPGIAWVVS